MSQTVMSVRGIGEDTAALLAGYGYVSVESLANTSVEHLMCVPGFGAIRAAAVIQAAEEIVDLSGAPGDVAVASGKERSGKKKADKKKADKKRADKKKADKKKADKKKADRKKADKKKADKKRADKKKADKKKADKKRADRKKAGKKKVNKKKK